MRRHLRPIALLPLFILVLAGIARADDISCGETLSRAINDNGIEDDLTFTAQQYEVVSVTVAAQAGQPFKFDPQWEITDSDGHRVPLTNDDIRCSSTEHQCETLPLPTSDTFTLSIRDDNHNAAGAYNVTLEAVSATANGQLNGPPAAVPACAQINQSGKPDGTQVIDRGQLIGGAIDGLGETDTFTFAGTAGEAVTIGLATGSGGDPSFDPVWELFGPSGAVVGGGDQGIVYCTDTCDRTLPATGVYTIKVYDFGYDGVGDYTVLLLEGATTTTTTVTTTTGAPPSTPTTLLPAGTAPIYELAKTLRRLPQNLGSPEELGAAVAIDSDPAMPAADRLLIGSPADETAGPAAGAVFVVRLLGKPGDSTYGVLLATLAKRTGTISRGDQFGAALAPLPTGSIVVGAPGDDAKGQDAGAAYVFGTDYLPAQRGPLTSPRGAAGGHFGAAVAVFDEQALVAAPGEDGVGRVYLFDASWTASQFFDAATAAAAAVDSQNATAAAPRAGDQFGFSIAAAGEEIAFGAPADANNSGRVFLYNTRTQKWRVITSPSPSPGDGFGSSVAFAGNGQIVIGAPGITPRIGKIFVLGQNRGKPAVDAGIGPYGGLGTSLAAFGSNGLLVGAPTSGVASGGAVFEVLLANDPSKDAPPVTQFAKQLPEAGDSYGTAVAARGSRIAIGSTGDDAGTVDGGAVYVYEPDSTTPAVFRKRLTPSGFGKALSANATDVLVGAPEDADGNGAVYRFDTRMLCTPNCPLLGSAIAGLAAGSRFGQTVAILDGTALVGAPSQAGSQGDQVGAAYVVNLQQVGPVLADPNPMAGDQFGFTVAAVDNDLLVSAPLLGTSDTGKVFDFTQSAGFPQRVAFAKPTPMAGDFFGAAIAVDGNTVAIGAPFDNTAAQNGGAVYLFRRDTAELLRADPLVSGAPVERELFGSALAISPQWIVVGAPLPDGNNDGPGRAYVFDRTTLAPVRALDSPSPHPGDHFGAAVAIVNGLVLVGAPYDDSGATDTGAAYLFDPSSGIPVQIFNNPAQNEFDHFGQTLVAGPAGPVIGAPGPARVYVYQPATSTLAASTLAARNAAGVSAAGPAPRCGNGIREGNEQCDDGNDIDTDDCRNDCTLQKCCTIDPLAADRCNDFDPCTDDILDPSGGCKNIDNGTCCTSDASCAGNGTCRLCAGCSLFPWDCCDQGAACILKSSQCSDKQCFDAATCECEGGLTCSDGPVPDAISKSLFFQACDWLRREQDGASDRTPLQVARSSAREARKMLRKAMHKTREQANKRAISKSCRKEIMTTLRRVRRSIPEGQRMRKCVAQEIAAGG